jgi:hypothetical protein
MRAESQAAALGRYGSAAGTEAFAPRPPFRFPSWDKVRGQSGRSPDRAGRFPRPVPSATRAVRPRTPYIARTGSRVTSVRAVERRRGAGTFLGLRNPLSRAPIFPMRTSRTWALPPACRSLRAPHLSTFSNRRGQGHSGQSPHRTDASQCQAQPERSTP